MEDSLVSGLEIRLRKRLSPRSYNRLCVLIVIEKLGLIGAGPSPFPLILRIMIVARLEIHLTVVRTLMLMQIFVNQRSINRVLSFKGGILVTSVGIAFVRTSNEKRDNVQAESVLRLKIRKSR